MCVSRQSLGVFLGLGGHVDRRRRNDRSMPERCQPYLTALVMSLFAVVDATIDQRRLYLISTHSQEKRRPRSLFPLPWQNNPVDTVTKVYNLTATIDGIKQAAAIENRMRGHTAV